MTTETQPKRINRANYLREIEATINNKRDIPYTMIDNIILRDKKLSWAEKGLLCYLLHLENGKSIKKTTLFENSENGRDGTIAIFDKLVDKSYIISVKHITTDGKYLWEYFVYTKPQKEANGANGAIPEKPVRQSPTGEAGTVNQEAYISNPSIEGKEINNNPPPAEGKRRVFKIPTLDEVTEYMESKGKDRVMANAFHNHHTARGWMLGKISMKDWRAACRTWIDNDLKFNPPSQQSIPIAQRPAPVSRPEPEPSKTAYQFRAPAYADDTESTDLPF